MQRKTTPLIIAPFFNLQSPIKRFPWFSTVFIFNFEHVFYLMSKRYSGIVSICGALRNLVPFIHFKNHEKHSWKSFTFNKVESFNLQLLKVTLFNGCFSHFLNCKNGTKSQNINMRNFYCEMFIWKYTNPIFQNIQISKEKYWVFL